jgi:hypothetical protein
MTTSNVSIFFLVPLKHVVCICLDCDPFIISLSVQFENIACSCFDEEDENDR